MEAFCQDLTSTCGVRKCFDVVLFILFLKSNGDLNGMMHGETLEV